MSNKFELFTVDDFLEILSYLKGDSTPNLDVNIASLSKSEQVKTKIYFENTIDQTVFASNDYKRLKNFLIDWYSSLKTISTTQRLALDPHSLPEDHINELIRSFGFDISTSINNLSYYNKAEFFLDLVNIYKIKGTPKSISKILDYFGVANIDLVEYWLQKDDNGNLIFKPEKTIISTYSDKIKRNNIKFNDITKNDPHWMLSEDQINYLFDNSKIRFPSRSPYFGVIPILYLDTINVIESILTRFCQDEYSNWVVYPNSLKRDIKISSISYIVSILELYVAIVYILISFKSNGKKSGNITYFDGTCITSIETILEEYKKIIGNKELPPSDYKTSRVKNRNDKKEKIILFDNEFTKPSSSYFLNDSTADILLERLNKNFKDDIDLWINSGKNVEILSYLLKDLDSWIKKRIGGYTSYSSIILGLESIDYIKKIVGFFKPYRSRLKFIEHDLIINNPLMDSVFVEDSTATPNIHVESTFVDFDTADSKPGFIEIPIPHFYITSIPPTIEDKQIYDMYINESLLLKGVYSDSTSDSSIYITSTPPYGSYRIQNLYLKFEDSFPILVIDYSNEPEKSYFPETTKIESFPTNYNYKIIDLYLDITNNIHITYDPEPFLWPDDSTANVYYSRETYDSGSYYDIGAACDSPIYNEIYNIISSDLYDILNSKPPDASSSIGNGIIDNEKLILYQYGGFVDFDNNGFFDSPFISDICQIIVTDF